MNHHVKFFSIILCAATIAIAGCTTVVQEGYYAPYYAPGPYYRSGYYGPGYGHGYYGPYHQHGDGYGGGHGGGHVGGGPGNAGHVVPH